MVTEKLKEYYVNNTTNDPQIITLYEYDVCDGTATPELVEGFAQTVPANTEVKVDFPKDGTYSVVIDGDTDNGTTAKYYLNLFNSFVVYTDAALCGNGTCLSRDEGDISYTHNALAKALYYISVNDLKYTGDLEDTFSKIKCSASEEFERLMRTESYLGTSSVESLSQIELGHIYMTLRTVDLRTDITEDVDEIYDYDNISYCIKKLGITDCDTGAPAPGTKHTTTLSANPTTLGLGVSTSITISYKFTANDDIFTEVVDTNIPNVTLAKLDGFTQTEIIPNQTSAKQYYITYKYTRGTQTLQNTISVSTTAYAPQWYGGESTTTTFNVGGQANASSIKAALTNIQPVYKSTASGTSANTDTSGKYIWWVTNAPVKFFVNGVFEIPTGPWSGSCDPNSYAIIHESVPTLMEDGVTIQTLYFYRTCPLQNLTGQTLQYTLTE